MQQITARARRSARKLNNNGHLLPQPLPRNAAGKRWGAGRAGRQRASFRIGSGPDRGSLHCLGSRLSISGRRERSNGIERTRDPNTTPGILSRAPRKAGRHERSFFADLKGELADKGFLVAAADDLIAWARTSSYVIFTYSRWRSRGASSPPPSPSWPGAPRARPSAPCARSCGTRRFRARSRSPARGCCRATP